MLEIHGFKTLATSYENTILTAGTIRESLRPQNDTVFTIFDPSGTCYRVKITQNGAMTVYMYSGGSAYQNNVIDFLCYIK